MSLTDVDMQNMVDWGVKMVRLGVMWEAVEKQPGIYDMEYLDEIEDIVNKLAKYGIYTMLDAHQDLFSRDFCGEGMPTFYTEQLTLEHKCPTSIGGLIFKIAG